MTEPLGGAISRVRTFFHDSPIPQVVLTYVIKVTELGDGDTCSVAIEEPDGRTWFVNVRFNSANAPEMTQVGGRQTADYTHSLLAGVHGTIKTRGRRDQRSRLLGDLYMWTGPKTLPLDVSKLVNEFVAKNGYVTGN